MFLLPKRSFARLESFVASARGAARAALFACFAVLAGCANPGPLKPPSLHLPRPAEGVTAERVGGRVELSWTVSQETTDGGTLRLPIMAVVCREAPGAGADRGQCTEVQRLGVAPGAARISDTLPPDVDSGAARLVAYRVELFNPKNHTAGPSAPAYVAAGAAPVAVGQIGVAARRNGALITWQAGSGDPGETMEVRRTLVATAGGAVEAKARKNAIAEEPGVAGTLRDAVLIANKSGSADSGGMIDRGVHDGDTVVYIAQRIRRVELEAPASIATGKDGTAREMKASKRLLELRGEASSPVTFVFHDTVPPQAPTGLAAVAGGGFGQPDASDFAVDLSWEANAEGDLLGYNVYRATAGAGSRFERVNQDVVSGPAFRDATAKAGVRYVYQVTAVDQRHNESAPSQSLTTEPGR